MLTRLLYFSQNHSSSDSGSMVGVLNEILAASNRNNRACGLTGALVFDTQWFIQALEGERATVWETFERIRDDERHSDVVVAEFSEIDARLFGNWWMGLATRRPATEHVFATFSDNGVLDPSRMPARRILGLLTSLAAVYVRRHDPAAEAA